ncbi:MAG: phosphoglycerate kinase [Candidatus Magasanikbacteria bacterium]|nr:phosphoglycerate kinase [Candidatus Magasanikbacteria bacterium]
MKYLRQLKNLEGKRVLMRVDFNVGFNKEGKIEPEDAIKIERTLPTIKYLVKQKAKIILVAHLGRPDGKIVEGLRLNGVADFVSEALKKKITKLDDVYGLIVEHQVRTMKNGQIILLENIRFEEGEETNSSALAKELSKLGDIFVNEAFGVSHRKAASICAITKYLPSYAGLLLEEEIKAMDYVLKKPKAPVVVIMGGLKFETKLPVIKKLLPKADQVLLGGGLSSTVLAALGYEVGSSNIGKEYLAEAKKIGENKKVFIPVDVVAGRKDSQEYKHCPVEKHSKKVCVGDLAIYDIGPHTVRAWAEIIKKANTIIWNGPMGFFEQHPFDKGSLSIAYLVGARSKGPAYGIVGGGETLAVMARSKMVQYVDHISTGGGAMLEYLSGKKLPGLQSLE